MKSFSCKVIPYDFTIVVWEFPYIYYLCVDIPISGYWHKP